MAVSTLQTRAKELVRSSKFTSGDKLSFRVPLDKDVVLPGNFSPAKYMDDLGIKKLDGLKVGVICPGNGGIVAEAIRRGASKVYVYEPRYLFQNAIHSVLSLLVKTDEQKIMFAERWPDSKDHKGLDLIIWPEGLEEAVDPRSVLKSVLSLLAPAGACYIEVVIGFHDRPGKSVNSWKPSEEALEATLKEEYEGATCEKVGEGRLTNRVIYRLGEDVIVAVDTQDLPLNTLRAEDLETTKPKRTTKTKKRKKPPAKVAKVMKILNMGRDSVEEQVSLWGDNWLDDVITNNTATRAKKKSPKQFRCTTSDNIGAAPIGKL